MLAAEIVWDTGMIAIAAPFVVAVAAILGHFWYKLNRSRSENVLKRSMVERGMSPEEIERVMNSGQGSK